MAADYTSESAADRLAAVRAAIARILNAQEYQTADGRRTRYAELQQLRAMEQQLQQEVGQSESGVLLGQMDVSP